MQIGGPGWIRSPYCRICLVYRRSAAWEGSRDEKMTAAAAREERNGDDAPLLTVAIN
jgi:hypothetical protein